MKLVAGLGNPGTKYTGTRHNVGFEVIDELSQRHQLTFQRKRGGVMVAHLREPVPAFLAKSQEFMNASGEGLGQMARYHGIAPADVFVVVDDVNLPLGRLRARARGSAGGHKGLKSVISALSTDDFPRLRIGVGGGHVYRDLSHYVLARFTAAERPVVREAIAKAADAVEVFLAGGIDVVMNRFNRKEDTEERTDKDSDLR